MQVFMPGTAFASAQAIGSPRSLTLADGASDGGSKPGGNVVHKFNFKVDASSSSQSYGSLTFQYCTTADPVVNGVGCFAPAGINVTGAAVASEAGSGITGFTVLSTASNEDAGAPNPGLINTFTLHLASAHPVTTPTVIAEAISGIVNPSTPNQTFFVRISAYASIDGTGAALDSGTVAASTANAIQLTGFMPESLVFCTGHTIAISGTTGLPDCTTATSGVISFNQLFDPNTTTWAYSQMAASTNALSGYAITVNGATLISGTNPIAAIGSTAAISIPGTAQFGLNLIDDKAPTAPTVTDPTIGAGSADPITYFDANGGSIFPVSDQANYTAKVSSGFDGTGGASNKPTYSFVGSNTLNTVATSADTVSTNPGPSDTQRYTSTYIVNVPGNQPAGTYVTTLTYICTPTY